MREKVEIKNIIWEGKIQLIIKKDRHGDSILIYRDFDIDRLFDALRHWSNGNISLARALVDGMIGNLEKAKTDLIDLSFDLEEM